MLHPWLSRHLFRSLGVMLAGVMLLAAALLPSGRVIHAATNCSTVSDVTEAECDALVDLYNALDGDNWDDNSNWLDEDNTVCDWYGITCSAGNVEYIELAYNSASGSIPASIDDFPALTTLNLDGLTGTIPNELANLTTLTSLRLSGPYQNSTFTGPIPDLSALSNLFSLEIAYNTFNGAVPGWINVTNFPNMGALALMSNGFTGAFPTAAINGFPLLSYLRISGSFTGSFPDLTGVCDTLEQLWLYGRSNPEAAAFDTASAFPSWINGTNCPLLYDLNVEYANLNGAFPDLSSLSVLSSLIIGHNAFDLGPVPAWLTSKTGLIFLSLANSLRTGTLPEFASAATLESLQLDNNRFDGQIPASYNLTNYPNLYNVNLFANQLDDIHPNFASFSSSPNGFFTSVYLNTIIPSAQDVAVQSLLDSIDINWRTWQIVPPVFTVSTVSSDTISVDVESIAVPGFFNVVYQIGVSEAPGGPYTVLASPFAAGGSAPLPAAVTISGLSPETDYYVAVFSRIGVGYGKVGVYNFYFRDSAYSAEQMVTTTAAGPTDCANTGATGIPQTECEALEDFYTALDGDNWTSATNWGESSPCSWEGITCSGGHVVQISFFNNGLTGAFPTSAFADLPELGVLDLSTNAITGPLPANMAATFPNLFRLGLTGNPLNTTIPSLTGMNALGVLELNSAGLTGQLPTLTEAAVPNLIFLSVYKNALTGNFPSDLCTKDSLSGLNLSGNFFDGEIPPCMADIPDLGVGAILSVVDVRYNRFTFNPANTDLITFLNSENAGWDTTQTLPPTGVSAVATGENTLNVSWTPIAYTGDTGGYRVFINTVPNAGGTLQATVSGKTATSASLNGLNAGTTYYVFVQSFTNPHGANPNTVVSAASLQASATTDGTSGGWTQPPTVVTLLSPADNAQINTPGPVLQWSANPAVELVTSYKLIVIRKSDGVKVVKDTFNTGDICDPSLCIVTIDGQQAGDYKWSVTATNSFGSTVTGKLNFSILAPQGPALITPTIGQIIEGTQSPVFTFTANAATDGITKYQLKVVEVISGTTALNLKYDVADICVAATCTIDLGNLPTRAAAQLGSDSYQAQVIAISPAGKGKGAKTAFSIAYPGVVTLQAPANNGMVVTLTPTLQWNDLSAADQFRVIVIDSASNVKRLDTGWSNKAGGNIICDSTSCTLDLSTLNPLPNLKDGKTYKWSIQARNSGVPSEKAKSAKFKFTILLPL